MRLLFRNFLIPLLLILTILRATGAHAAEEITDSRFGFSFKIPEPFAEQEVNPEQPDTLHSYVDRNPEPGNPANVIQIQRLRSLVNPNDHFTPADMAKFPTGKATLESLSWNGLKLDLIRTVMEQAEGEPIVGYTVQIPLQKEGVQIVIGGPASRDEEIRKIFNTTAADFKNLKPLYAPPAAARKSGSLTSEPMTPEQRASKMFRGIALLLISAAVLFAVVRSIFRLFRKAK